MVDREQSESTYRKIRPASVDLTRADIPQGSDPHAGQSAGFTPPVGEAPAGPRRWRLAALSLLVALALGVLFFAPEWISGPSTPAVDNAPPPTSSAPVTESPFQQAQLQKARSQAQEILRQILSAQDELEGRAVDRWGPDEFADALEKARQGDRLYQQRDFTNALGQYQSALDDLEMLSNRVPQVIADSLSRGAKALAEGDKISATEAYDLVTAIESDNEKARRGLARASTIDQTYPLYNQSITSINSGDFDSAIATLEKVLELDPAFESAARALSSARGAKADMGFQRAMDEGFEALRLGRHKDASQAFNRAIAIKPNHPDALAGLKQTETALGNLWTQQQLAKALELENREQWREALTIYRAVLDRDDSIVPARVGSIRAEARAGLDESITALLDDPLRLSNPGVYQQAQSLLAEARNLGNPGPRLEAQTHRLASALADAREPVSVTLQSDNATRVSLLRVSELGQFDRREVNLVPGRYVAVGSRPGYRDVRVEFTVASGEPVTVQIICKEPV